MHPAVRAVVLCNRVREKLASYTPGHNGLRWFSWCHFSGPAAVLEVQRRKSENGGRISKSLAGAKIENSKLRECKMRISRMKKNSLHPAGLALYFLPTP